MILVIDNYDSFTYNLVQYIGEILLHQHGKKTVTDRDLKVVRNNQITLEEIEKLKPERIVISPGPCSPKEAGISTSIYEHFAEQLPILGVCLGHQCLGESFGGNIVRARVPMHGKTSLIYHDGQGIFKGMENPFEATRYHSLIVERASCPKNLHISAWTKEGEIMGLRHKIFPWIEGVQFHPESILTKNGKKILENFLKLQKS